MTKTRVVLDHKGFAELLKSPEVLAAVRDEAEAMADRAGPGMAPDAFVGRRRVVGGVITASPAAREREAKDRALTRAIGGTR